MDDIKSIVKNAVLDAIQLHNQGPMNINEAADYLRISKRKMQDLLPYINHSIVGGRRIFTKADLDQYIQDQKVY